VNKGFVKKSSLLRNQEHVDSSFVLFDDKVIIYSLVEDELYGVFLQNKAVKDFFEKMFYEFWDKAE